MKCTNKNAHCFSSGLTKCSVKENKVAEQIVAVEYREIPGYPGYEVGSDGTVWSNRRRNRKQLQTQESNGYLRIELQLNGVGQKRAVHQLVLEAFVGPCPEGMQACHFPIRDRSHNHLSNLRWDTPKENHADMLVHGTRLMGEQLPWHKLTAADVQTIRERFAAGASTRELADQYGIAQANIGGIVKGEHWKSAPGPVVTRNLKPPKLTDDDVRSIRSRHAAEGTKALAEEFGISRDMVRCLMSGKRRAQVPQVTEVAQ